VRQIEDEVRLLIVAAQREAERRVHAHRVELDGLVDALLIKETLEPEALKKLLGPQLGTERDAPQSGVLH
jgi:ATP-dependent Zn protease